MTADAELHKDEGSTVESSVEVVRDLEPPGVARRGKHPLREAADDLPAFRVDVVEDELVQGDAFALPCEAGHELGRVGRAAADDGELHGRVSSKEPKPEWTLRGTRYWSQGVQELMFFTKWPKDAQPRLC